MTAITTLGVDNLSLRGAGTEYNLCTRLFTTKAEADAALALGAASGGWVPTAGKTNICLTADEGILKYDFNTTALVNSDSATRAYVDAQVAALVDSAPGALDTLNELAAAINDDANAFNTLNNAIAAVQADVDQNETDADAAIAAVQADVNQNETDADAAIAAVQADVDQNETDGDAADAALSGRLDTLEADPTTQTLLTAEATTRATADTALSGRLDTLEADPTTATALAAVQADVNQNEADSDSADAALSARITTLEADPTTATAVAAVQADVDQNEADADTAIALKADIASPTFTGTPTAPTASAGTNTTQLATTAYVSTAVSALIDGAPGAINTLNELAAALGDDANFATTITNSIAAVQSDVNQNESDADTAIAGHNTRLNALEGNAAVTDPTTATALAAVQADVDANETASDNAEAALSGRLDTLEADPTTKTYVDNSTATEAVARQATDTALSNRVTVLEADPTTATAVAAVQADVDQNESDADAAIALKASLTGANFTGDLLLKKSDGSAVDLEFSRTDHADMNTVFKIGASYIDINKECLVISGGGQPIAYFDERQRVSINKTDPDHTLDVGGDGKFSTNLTVGGAVNLTLINAADDTAAAGAGVAVGALYRNGSVVMIRVS